MAIKINAILLFLSSIMISACYHEPELSSDMPEVCFDSEVLPVIQSSCVRSGCHDGSEAFFLGDYNAVANQVTPGKPMASELHKVVSTDYGFLKMPPPPNEPLTPGQIDKISLWILQGAKHTTCEEICDSTNVTFSGSILPLMDTYCRGCHAGSNPDGGFVLTDYNSVKTAVEGGRVMGAVRWQDGFLPMPDKSDKLSDCNIAILQKWINLGMPNN